MSYERDLALWRASSIELARPQHCKVCAEITPHWVDGHYLRCMECDPPEPEQLRSQS